MYEPNLRRKDWRMITCFKRQVLDRHTAAVLWLASLCSGGVAKAGRRGRIKAVRPTAALWESVQRSSIAALAHEERSSNMKLQQGQTEKPLTATTNIFHVKSFGVELAIDVGSLHTSFQIVAMFYIQWIGEHSKQ